mgnify:CR=1 FL=1
MKEHPMTGFFLQKMGIKTYVIDDNEGIITPTLTTEQRTTLDNYITNEADLQNLRVRRNNKLAKSDWMANSDVTMSDAWKTYRQALRDLPANTSDPSNPTWPTKPS